jgi:hypothetical protein
LSSSLAKVRFSSNKWCGHSSARRVYGAPTADQAEAELDAVEDK